MPSDSKHLEPILAQSICCNTTLLSVVGLISPFVIFAAGAFAVARSLSAAEVSRRWPVAAASALLLPVLLLLFLFS